MSTNQTINKRDALIRMRELSSQNIPFSFGFITCNTTRKTSKGYKRISKALLRPGLKNNKSNRSNLLIAYTDFDSKEDKPSFFYYPLLMMFNGLTVNP